MLHTDTGSDRVVGSDGDSRLMATPDLSFHTLQLLVSVETTTVMTDITPNTPGYY